MSGKAEITKWGTISEDEDGNLLIANFVVEDNDAYEDPRECLIRLIIERLRQALT